MSRTKDYLCISQGVPTLHDVCKSLGLEYNPDRTTEAILRRVGKAKKVRKGKGKGKA